VAPKRSVMGPTGPKRRAALHRPLAGV